MAVPLLVQLVQPVQPAGVLAWGSVGCVPAGSMLGTPLGSLASPCTLLAALASAQGQRMPPVGGTECDKISVGILRCGVCMNAHDG